ncbi:MAG: hypothetical protein Q8K74_01590 [Candidatus Nitrotoga sp.]|nr:hypothetical protein [Candidatus Nitrotoga sp.]
MALSRKFNVLNHGEISMEQYFTACRISEQKTVGFDGVGKFVPNPVKNRMGEPRRHIRLLIAKESARFI